MDSAALTESSAINKHVGTSLLREAQQDAVVRFTGGGKEAIPCLRKLDLIMESFIMALLAIIIAS